MKISMGTWAFSFGPFADNPVPFEKIVERLAKAGFDGVEICGFPPHVTLDSCSTPESRKDLVRLLQDYRMGVSGYAADLTLVNPLTEGNRQRYLDLFRRNVELCADICSPSIRVDTLAAPGSIADDEYDEAFRRLADLWHEAAEHCKQAGLIMAWEFEPGFAINKPSEILELHRQVSHPNFRVLFDTAHAYMCAVMGARQHGFREVLPGGVASLLDLLDDRIGAIHLNDSDGTLYCEETSTHVPFGEGDIDFASLAPKLRAVPNIDWWCIDLCFFAGCWERVESSLEFVRKLTRKGASFS